MLSRWTKQKTISNDNIKAGDRIKHDKFGEGLVIETDAKTITIMFDSVGRKKNRQRLCKS